MDFFRSITAFLYILSPVYSVFFSVGVSSCLVLKKEVTLKCFEGIFLSLFKYTYRFLKKKHLESEILCAFIQNVMDVYSYIFFLHFPQSLSPFCRSSSFHVVASLGFLWSLAKFLYQCTHFFFVFLVAFTLLIGIDVQMLIF